MLAKLRFRHLHLLDVLGRSRNLRIAAEQLHITQDRLFGQEADLLERYDFDIDIAAAALLARDAAALAPGAEAVPKQLVTILGDERVFHLLLDHMAFGDRLAVAGDGRDPRRVHPRMQAFRAEFRPLLGLEP
ncbi:hypothetical protein AU476_30720 [Cupriavidus sp. UYMSc13B]|nr:hypothetical protein AU476_30720 [Cupriavidus sp. UYMSc13B]